MLNKRLFIRHIACDLAFGSH